MGSVALALGLIAALIWSGVGFRAWLTAWRRHRKGFDLADAAGLVAALIGGPLVLIRNPLWASAIIVAVVIVLAWILR